MRCPICKKPISESGDESKHLPFCSERCKLIDLGRWLDGKYQIPLSDSQTDADLTDDDPDLPLTPRP